MAHLKGVIAKAEARRVIIDLPQGARVQVALVVDPHQSPTEIEYGLQVNKPGAGNAFYEVEVAGTLILCPLGYAAESGVKVARRWDSADFKSMPPLGRTLQCKNAELELTIMVSPQHTYAFV